VTGEPTFFAIFTPGARFTVNLANYSHVATETHRTPARPTTVTLHAGGKVVAVATAGGPPTALGARADAAMVVELTADGDVGALSGVTLRGEMK
jgi:hypothetical protein